MPVERVEFIHLDWFDLPYPRGIKEEDTIDEVKAKFLNIGSDYNSNLLYDISAIYPGTDPLEGDYSNDRYQMFAGGRVNNYYGSRIIEYIWVSSPNKEDWKEYYRLWFYFSNDGKSYGCMYSYSNDTYYEEDEWDD